jgi:hypothetical protein
MRRAALVVLAVLVLAGCGGDDDASAPPTTIRLEPETTTTTTPDDAALARLLVDDALPGMGRADDELLDLDGAATADADPAAERTRLTDAGFVRGIARRWAGPHGDVAYIAAYELGSDAQATAYLEASTDALVARGAESFDVTDPAGGRGLTTTESDFVGHAVAFTRGSRWFFVLVGAPDGSRTVDDATALATAQAAAAG